MYTDHQPPTWSWKHKVMAPWMLQLELVMAVTTHYSATTTCYMAMVCGRPPVNETCPRCDTGPWQRMRNTLISTKSIFDRVLDRPGSPRNAAVHACFPQPSSSLLRAPSNQHAMKNTDEWRLLLLHILCLVLLRRLTSAVSVDLISIACLPMTCSATARRYSTVQSKHSLTRLKMRLVLIGLSILSLNHGPGRHGSEERTWRNHCSKRSVADA